MYGEQYINLLAALVAGLLALNLTGCSSYGGQIVIGWAPINAVDQTHKLERREERE